MWQTIRKEEILRKLKTNEKIGLTEEEAKKERMNMGKTN